MLVQIEGIRGSGRTMQCERIKGLLENAGYTATIANEPGMTETGTFLSRVIQSNSMPRDAITEMFLCLAKEAELYQKIIIPENSIPGHLVLRNGGAGSFISHYYLTTRLSIETLVYLFECASAKHRAVVTFLLDVSPDLALRRMKGVRKESKFDVLSRDFLKKQSGVLLHLAAILPNWIVLNGADSVSSICDLMLKRLRENV